MNIPREKLEGLIAALEDQIDMLKSEIGERPNDTEIRRCAETFAGFDDDAQAKFFCIMAGVMDRWGAGKRDQQSFYIGRHLRDCECSTPEGREFLMMITEAMKP